MGMTTGGFYGASNHREVEGVGSTIPFHTRVDLPPWLSHYTASDLNFLLSTRKGVHMNESTHQGLANSVTVFQALNSTSSDKRIQMFSNPYWNKFGPMFFQILSSTIIDN